MEPDQRLQCAEMRLNGCYGRSGWCWRTLFAAIEDASEDSREHLAGMRRRGWIIALSWELRSRPGARMRGPLVRAPVAALDWSMRLPGRALSRHPLSDLDRDRPVHPEQLDRGSTNRGRSDNREVGRQLEMILPALRTRIEHARGLAGLRISRLGPGPLPEGARDAGQGEVLLRRGPTVPPWSHVIDVKGRFLSSLRDTAVLAVITRPQPDPPLKR